MCLYIIIIILYIKSLETKLQRYFEAVGTPEDQVM